MKVAIRSVSRHMVGNTAEVWADIIEDVGAYARVRDTIIVSVEGGARMGDDALKRKIEEVYDVGKT